MTSIYFFLCRMEYVMRGVESEHSKSGLESIKIESDGNSDQHIVQRLVMFTIRAINNGD